MATEGVTGHGERGGNGEQGGDAEQGGDGGG